MKNNIKNKVWNQVWLQVWNQVNVHFHFKDMDRVSGQTSHRVFDQVSEQAFAHVYFQLKKDMESGFSIILQFNQNIKDER
jgi:hypothetical protein